MKRSVIADYSNGNLFEISEYLQVRNMFPRDSLIEAKKILTFHHIGNILLSIAFFFVKITPGLCNIIFGIEGECGLDRVTFKYFSLFSFHYNNRAMILEAARQIDVRLLIHKYLIVGGEGGREKT